jgi:hypothetical protein
LQHQQLAGDLNANLDAFGVTMYNDAASAYVHTP